VKVVSPKATPAAADREALGRAARELRYWTARARSFSCRATLLSISRKPRGVTRLRYGLIGRSGRATTPGSASSSLTKARLIGSATVDRRREVVEPDPAADHAVFGMAVTVLREDETEATFRIVGEDEADPSTGRIAWTAPVVQALLGSRPGDLRRLPTGEVEVLSVSGTPEALE
jgi:Transcription elongation factor, GreA/GreB, C-term